MPVFRAGTKTLLRKGDSSRLCNGIRPRNIGSCNGIRPRTGTYSHEQESKSRQEPKTIENPKKPDPTSAKTVTAIILSIGNELLIGDTINTNASWIGRFLTERGFVVTETRTITDRDEVIQQAIRQAMDQADLVITTGGLGPTHDDLTKISVARLFDSGMVTSREVLEHLGHLAAQRNQSLSDAHREQAEVPEACEVLLNERGTAPGMWFEQNDTCLAVLPGVPSEMTYLMENGVEPKLRERFNRHRPVRAVHYLQTAGVPESVLSGDVIGNLEEYLQEGNEVAYLPRAGQVTIRVSCYESSRQKAEEKMAPLLDHLRKQAKGLIFGEGRGFRLAQAVGERLAERRLTLAAAESCTGGRISDAITDIPGSSSYFRGGVIAYDNTIKRGYLGVSEKDLQERGAVSKEVALQMARGVAEAFDADIGVSATGVAGPGGGSGQKPVGTVWLGFWIDGHHFALKAFFSHDRWANKERTVTVALETVRRALLKTGTLPETRTLPFDIKPEYA